MFPTLFLFITFLAFGSNVFAIISRIRFVLSSIFAAIDFLQLVSSGKWDCFDDESDNDGYDSGSAGMCAFPFHFYELVGCVVKSVGPISGVGSGIFVPTGIE